MSEHPEPLPRAHVRYVGDGAPFVLPESVRPTPGGLVREKGVVLEVEGWAAEVMLGEDPPAWEQVEQAEAEAAIEQQVEDGTATAPAVPHYVVQDMPAYSNPGDATGVEIDRVLVALGLPTDGLVAERRARLEDHLRDAQGAASTTDTGDSTDE